MLGQNIWGGGRAYMQSYDFLIKFIVILSNFERTHDMRLSLGCFQTVASDDREVQKILEGIHLSADGVLTLTPKSRNWSVESIRHKTRRAYLYGKKNYLVTVSCVEAYKIRAGHSKQATITLTQKDWEKHYEVEVLQTLCRITCYMRFIHTQRIEL